MRKSSGASRPTVPRLARAGEGAYNQLSRKSPELSFAHRHSGGILSQSGSTPLAGQVAIITGAGRGIGAAIAVKIAALGARAILCGRTRAALELTAGAIQNSGGQSAIVECDVNDLRSVESLAERVDRAFGRLDILVNNAGIMGPAGPLHELAPEAWDRIFNTNLRGVYYTVRSLAPLMIRSRSGHIINISSLAGKNALAEWGGILRIEVGFEWIELFSGRGVARVQHSRLGYLPGLREYGVQRACRKESGEDAPGERCRTCRGDDRYAGSAVVCQRNFTEADAETVTSYELRASKSFLQPVHCPKRWTILGFYSIARGARLEGRASLLEQILKCLPGIIGALRLLAGGFFFQAHADRKKRAVVALILWERFAPELAGCTRSGSTGRSARTACRSADRICTWGIARGSRSNSPESHRIRRSVKLSASRAC